eukprot:gene19245-25875_t
MRTVALLALLTLSAALHAAAGAPPQDPSQSSAGATDVTDTRICLNMIVKNEADTLPQLFESMVEHIFGGVICDTGSTDGTVQYIHAYFAEHGLQGEVVHHNWTDNFGHNRNLCLSEVMRWSKENAPPGHDNLCDYFMFLDADQVLQKEPGEENSNLNLKRMGLDQDAYLMSEREAVAGMMYSNIRLASTRKVWEWEGAVHEVVHMTDGSAHVENTKTIAGMYFTHDADGGPDGKLMQALDTIIDTVLTNTVHLQMVVLMENGGPDGKRYERDATILEHTIEEEPENTQAHFYMAQTYNSLQRWKALLIFPPTEDPMESAMSVMLPFLSTQLRRSLKTHERTSIWRRHGGPNGKRYERDATILEHTIEEEPENTRAHFYLAQTYNSLQRWGDALRMYMKRVGMSHGWIEENYVAAYEIAELSRVR